MSRWHVYGTKYVFSTPSVFPGGMDSTLSCLLSQDIQLPGHDLSLSGINLFFLFFLVKVKTSFLKEHIASHFEPVFWTKKIKTS